MTHGFRLSDIGTPQLSWVEFRDILQWSPPNGSSALFRALHPDDWIWADPTTAMAAEVATLVRDLRYFAAARVMPEVPDEYAPGAYGPRGDDSSDRKSVDETTEADSDARARTAAAEIRAEMGI